MTVRTTNALLALAAGLLLAGCPAKQFEPSTATPVDTIEVLPAETEVSVSPGAPATLEFTAVMTREDGSTEETTGVEWDSSNITVGGIDADGVFTTGDTTGGRTNVRASYMGAWGETTLTVVYTREMVEEGAPADAPGLFDDGLTEEDIDAPLMLLSGPMKMTFGEYLSDIGITYLCIPAVTIGIGVAGSWRAR